MIILLLWSTTVEILYQSETVESNSGAVIIYNSRNFISVWNPSTGVVPEQIYNSRNFISVWNCMAMQIAIESTTVEILYQSETDEGGRGSWIYNSRNFISVWNQ